jgi:hypothetical protein
MKRSPWTDRPHRPMCDSRELPPSGGLLSVKVNTVSSSARRFFPLQLRQLLKLLRLHRSWRHEKARLRLGLETRDGRPCRSAEKTQETNPMNYRVR